MFENFWGNRAVTESLEQMIAGQRLAQTLLFSGREGVGKATLARRMAARLLGHAELVEKDDLALSDNLETIAAREKWTAEKRNKIRRKTRRLAKFAESPLPAHRSNARAVRPQTTRQVMKRSMRAGDSDLRG